MEGGGEGGGVREEGVTGGAVAACPRQRTFVAVGIAFYGLCLSAIVGCGHLRSGFGHSPSRWELPVA